MIRATFCMLWLTAVFVCVIVNGFQVWTKQPVDIIPLGLLLAAGVVFVVCNPRNRA